MHNFVLFNSILPVVVQPKGSQPNYSLNFRHPQFNIIGTIIADIESKIISG